MKNIDLINMNYFTCYSKGKKRKMIIFDAGISKDITGGLE